MKTLGLGTGADSGAAVVEDGRILAAVNEERLCRWKMVEGFPRGSIREVLRLSDTDRSTVDCIMVGATEEPWIDDLMRFDGWFQTELRGVKGAIKKAAGSLAPYRDLLPFLEAGYYAIQQPQYLRRKREIRRVMAEEFGMHCPLVFVDHHLCHLASTYYTSGFRDALVISVDGGGDRLSSLVYTVREGRWKFHHKVSAYNSLGNYYAYVTHICGFKASKHEGKITGLAASGQPLYRDLLRSFIDEQDGTFHNRGRCAFQGAVRKLRASLPSDWKREDLAASIQVHCEDVMRRYVGHWARATGLSDVAFAGGVAANVRINEEIHALPEVERIFIHPHMGDGGLSVGAALAACIPGIAPEAMSVRARRPIRDVYLGPRLTKKEIEDRLMKEGLTPEAPRQEAIEERIARLLADGYVVARAEGRMEYGPRALGNRSILYQPSDRSVNDWLNKNLKRTEFMPFAPAVLFEQADSLFLDLAGAEHAAEFMTITKHCSPWMRRHMSGVVHLDGTARPHLVRRDINRGFYDIISAFRRRTGLPGIINTSFNMHEEPIVCSVDDCVRAFLLGNIDYLAIGGHLVKHPRAAARELRPAPRAA
jgi:carbamoyltransferase